MSMIAGHIANAGGQGKCPSSVMAPTCAATVGLQRLAQLGEPLGADFGGQRVGADDEDEDVGPLDPGVDFI